MGALLLKSVERLYKLLKVYTIVALVGAGVVLFFSLSAPALKFLADLPKLVYLPIIIPAVIAIAYKLIQSNMQKGKV